MNQDKIQNDRFKLHNEIGHNKFSSVTYAKRWSKTEPKIEPIVK